MKILATALFFAWGILWGGWLFHRSVSPDIGPWSWSYVAFLAVSAAGGGVPWLLLRLSQRWGPARTRRLLTGAIGTILLVWLTVSKIFDVARSHDFDIWLQMSPPATTVPRARTPGALRILCLGGSTTRGPGLKEAQKYPVRLQRRLADDGLRVEVINAGMYWYTSRHSQVAWSLTWRHWNPDVVVLMHAFNDMCRSFSPAAAARGPYREDWGHYYGPALPAARRDSFEEWLVRNPLHWLEESWGSRWRTRWRPMPASTFRSLPQFEEAYGALLQDLVDKGVQVLAVTQPSRYRTVQDPEDRRRLWSARDLCGVTRGLVREVPDPVTLASAMSLYNETVRSLAEQRGVRLVEGASALPGDWDHFTDGLHHTARGADRLAGRVAAAVLKLPSLRDGAFRNARPGP